ncbi:MULTISPECIES: efflux RND transporter periplasmic adaptor subunit [Chelativorans]|uniref:Efflux RND transporter periplasmic adaptor subunit n=1 Tax=Chelativorans intermedius TaxID=515947 RepID=A0ABV6DCM1_9HYPH|nr:MULTISPECIES: efflux RND transporter periplasmic adaptor subunit [Chelativorans]MCT9000582.1 efflux RND transporter periplasmic adaptor subunit [Chelativorans intermedius]WEX12167.1 efflux RND transporter periplasmic adaptor subunit [Chelativorans sp. AA-79]
MGPKWPKRFGVAAVLAMAAVGAVVYGAGGRTPEPTKAGAMAPEYSELAQVEVTTVEPRSMSERVRVSGELQPVNRAVVKAKVSGTVLEVDARPGQAVKSGDVLVRFETEDLQSALVQQDSNLDAARAQLELAEQTLEKTERLAERGYATTAALEKAQSDVTAARANVQGLEAQSETARTALGDAVLVAPFDGIVASRSVEPGETVAANTELMTVVDTSVLEAEVLVSTRDITRLKVEQTAELQVDGLEGSTITGTVDRINPVANEGSRLVPVFIRLENTEGRLWGGMFATGSILVRQEEDVLAIPQTALRDDEEGQHVLKITDGKLVRRPVELGPIWDGGRLVEITSGIVAGDTVLSAPLPELQADMPVTISTAG